MWREFSVKTFCTVDPMRKYLQQLQYGNMALQHTVATVLHCADTRRSQWNISCTHLLYFVATRVFTLTITISEMKSRKQTC